MRIECQYCHKQYSLRDDNAGKQFRCGACGKLSPISSPSAGQVAIQTPTPRPAAGASGGPPPAAPSGERWAIDCRHCGRRHSVRAEMAGKQFVCKDCGKLTTIVPPEAIPDDDEILVAMPVAAAPAMSTARVLPTAQIVYSDDDGAGPVTPADDLFGDSPATPARRIPLPAAAPARSQAPKPPAKKKKKRRASTFEAPPAMRVIFGSITAVIGAAIAVWGIYAFLHPEAEVRRPGRAIALGVVIASAGVKWVRGISFSKD